MLFTLWTFRIFLLEILWSIPPSRRRRVSAYGPTPMKGESDSEVLSQLFRFYLVGISFAYGIVLFYHHNVRSVWMASVLHWNEMGPDEPCLDPQIAEPLMLCFEIGNAAILQLCFLNSSKLLFDASLQFNIRHDESPLKYHTPVPWCECYASFWNVSSRTHLNKSPLR